MEDGRATEDSAAEPAEGRPAFSWPGRRRGEQAAEAADRAALRGLERLRARSEVPPEPPPPEQEDELRALVVEATEQLRDEIRAEGRRIELLLEAERERLEEVVQDLYGVIARLEGAGASVPAVEERPELPESEESVDLNSAGPAELHGIGMSQTQASRVIRHRDFWGEFHSVSELAHVPGFAPELREELEHRLHVSTDDGA